MDQHEDIFQVTVEFNPGLEPLTLSVIAQNIPLSDKELAFKIKRHEDHLATIQADSNHHWTLLSGDIDQDEVNAIGAAIDAHYT